MNKKCLKHNNIDTNIKDYLDNIVEQIPYFIFWKNKDFVYLGCNQKFATLVNKKSPQDVIGETDLTLGWGQGESELFRHGDQEVINGNPKINEEEVLLRPDGVQLIMLVNKLPMFDKQGQCIGILGTSVDITERKKLEENLKAAKEKAEVASQAKTEFLENMRHDIRTPLTGIVGCAHLIKMQADCPEKVSEYANDLINSSDALMDFLNRVLESITVTSGEVPLLKKHFNLQEILMKLIHLHRPQAIIKGLQLTLDYDVRIPALVGDVVRVQKMILELLTNALKYTAKGQIKVSARLLKNKVQNQKIFIELRVEDTGVGIPKKKHHEIYTPFTRLTPSSQGIYPGTGMGLSLVKQFIQELGGEIHLESQEGKGSLFVCIIPFQKSSFVEEVTQFPLETGFTFNKDPILTNQKIINKTSLTKGISLKQNRVLVVEDNGMAAKIMKHILFDQGCQVDIATNSKSALNQVENNTYDLILMDIGLPDEEGCEVTRRIRLQQSKKNRWLPIIGVTAHIAQEKKQRCIENGMNAVYSKPLTLEKLVEIFNTFVFSKYPSHRILEHTAYTPQQAERILDLEQATKLIGDDGLVKECLNLFIKDLNEDLPILEQQYQAHDWQLMKEQVHKWKGGASYCGAHNLIQACQKLYLALEKQRIKVKTVELLYQQLLQAVDQVQQVVKKVLVFNRFIDKKTNF